MALAFVSLINSLATKLLSSIQSSSSSSSSSTGVDEDLKKLQRTLQRILVVLADAERREIQDDSVKLWLKELKGVAYDAEDVLEEYQFALLRAQLVAGSEAGISHKRKREDGSEQQVRDSNSTLSQLLIPEKIRGIRERFDEISKDRDALRLREGDGRRRPDVSMNWPLTTSSHVDESGIFGRNNDTDEVIKLLFTDEDRKFSVIAIVGMAGIGKTTLAQLVYNDPKVREYFDYKGWVCVSESFDVSRLTKEIVESITGEPCSLTQLNALHDTLGNQVKGKKLLLVLDDVWNEQQGPWDSLRAPFRYAPMVRIILTTRNDLVAEIMQTDLPPYRPGLLSYDHCWSLFKQRAFGGRDPKDYPHLVEIGHKIIRKCGRLPLSVKTIGGLLHYELDEDRWMEILESDLWEMEQARKDIIPALMLSYYHLPAHLKPCFLYSSIFPKDYRFKKSRLVRLWIAQGFILPGRKKRLEDIGRKYFDELRRRSLFQLSPIFYGDGFDDDDDEDDGDEYSVLHDAIHDLARAISDNEHYSIKLSGQEGHQIPKEVRHLYVDGRFYHTDPSLKFCNPRALRTLIISSDAVFKCDEIAKFDSFSCLRAVEMWMGHGRYISIRNLIHLHHLLIKSCKDDAGLQRPLVHLYNLSLGINFRQELSIDTSNLLNLHYLSLSGPAFFTDITNIEDNTEARYPHGQPPSMLKEGKLMKQDCYPCISNCEKYVTSTVIFTCLVKLNIENNSKLRRLPMLSSSLRSLRIHYCTNLTSLSCLKNLTSLQKLHLSRCPQLEFEQEESLPSTLQNVHISDCWKQMVLTGLQNISSLQSIKLERCPLLQFSPDGCLPCRPHRVNVTDCPRLAEWCRRNQFGYFQVISACKVLTITSPTEITDYIGVDNLSSLKWLCFNSSAEICLLSKEWLPPTLQTLEIYSTALKSIVVRQKLSSLRKVIIEKCMQLISVVGLQNLISLEELVIANCPVLHISPDDHLPTSLKRLRFKCSAEICPLSEEWLPSALETLEVYSTPLKSIVVHQKLSSPRKVIIENCMHLTSVVGLQNFISLDELVIVNCPVLQFFPDGHLPSSLKRLRFSSSAEIYLLSEEWLPSTLQTLEVCSRPLKSIIVQQKLSSPRKVIIENCMHLTSVVGLQNLISLEVLIIVNCPVLQFSPDDHLPSSLHSLTVSECRSLRSLPMMHSNNVLSKLQNVYIRNCLNLTVLAGLQKLTCLKRLELEMCPFLEIVSQQCLSCRPQHVEVIDCPGLKEWCERHQFYYTQDNFLFEGRYQTGKLGWTTSPLFKLQEFDFPSEDWLPCSASSLLKN